MSIPLDRLYHYIESVARDIHSDTIIYRFYPHGSKNLDDLTMLNVIDIKTKDTFVELICHDQEPLHYDYYKDKARENTKIPNIDIIKDSISKLKYTHLRSGALNIHDKCLLLHSEINSDQVLKYSQDYFIPVYYWSHALIAQDWFRYARYVSLLKKSHKKFLIYNRAWSGTREYRLKFADELIKYNLVNQCHTSCSVLNEQNVHYTKYVFENSAWIPNNVLENYFQSNSFAPTASADFTVCDYQNTDIEVVLETLFDDTRIHLTEKTLRPIALGQPFILVGPAGSLEYLKSYGFKTFSSIFNETYDTIQDPILRLNKILKLMSEINNLPKSEYCNLVAELTKIANYNKFHFFSDTFFNQVVNELKQNLQQGMSELLSTNTYSRYITLKQKLNSNSDYKNWCYNEISNEQNTIRDSIFKLALKLQKSQNK